MAWQTGGVNINLHASHDGATPFVCGLVGLTYLVGFDNIQFTHGKVQGNGLAMRNAIRESITYQLLQGVVFRTWYPHFVPWVEGGCPKEGGEVDRAAFERGCPMEGRLDRAVLERSILSPQKALQISPESFGCAHGSSCFEPHLVIARQIWTQKGLPCIVSR